MNHFVKIGGSTYDVHHEIHIWRKNLIGVEMNIRKTLALCILQTPEYRIWVQKEAAPCKMSHTMAAKYCSTTFQGEGLLPRRSEILWLWQNFKSCLKHKHYWTADIHPEKGAYTIDGGNGFIGYANFNCHYYVKPFYKERININNN